MDKRFYSFFVLINFGYRGEFVSRYIEQFDIYLWNQAKRAVGLTNEIPTIETVRK